MKVICLLRYYSAFVDFPLSTYHFPPKGIPDHDREAAVDTSPKDMKGNARVGLPITEPRNAFFQSVTSQCLH